MRGQPNMNQLLKQAQKMQQQMADAQDELAQSRVEGQAGGGLVTATVSGTGELVELNIGPAAIDPDDPETLADLVIAAVRAAQENATRLTQEKLGPLAGGMGGLPSGFGF